MIRSSSRSPRAAIVTWQDFPTAFPEGRALSRETSFRRDYGRNPYTGYDAVGSFPFLFDGPTDRRLLPMTRVVGLAIGGEAVAFPSPELEKRGVVQTTVGG